MQVWIIYIYPFQCLKCRHPVASTGAIYWLISTICTVRRFVAESLDEGICDGTIRTTMMVTRASCIVYHKFTHHPFRTNIKWRLPIPISEKHYKLIHDSGGANLPKFSWWEFCCSNPTAWCRRIPQSYPPVHRKPWVVGTKMPRARDLPGHLRPAPFFSSEVNHHWKEAPTASFTCEKGKGKQRCWCYLLSNIQFLMLLARKTIYTIWCYWISWVSTLGAAWLRLSESGTSSCALSASRWSRSPL